MHIRITTETKNRLLRFYRNKRAFVSLVVLVVAYLLSLTSPWTVNDEPLYLKYNGKSYFPAFVRYSEQEFGGDYQTEADYGKLFADVRECEEDAAEGYTKAGGCPEMWALMPPIAHDPLKADLTEEGAPPFAPSSRHWLGTDSNGRDVLARLIHGFRICISFSLFLTILGTFLGIVIGGIQGYLGKFWDTGMQRIIEIWSSLPMLYIVILIGSLQLDFIKLLYARGVFEAPQYDLCAVGKGPGPWAQAYLFQGNLAKRIDPCGDTFSLYLDWRYRKSDIS